MSPYLKTVFTVFKSNLSSFALAFLLSVCLGCLWLWVQQMFWLTIESNLKAVGSELNGAVQWKTGARFTVLVIAINKHELRECMKIIIRGRQSKKGAVLSAGIWVAQFPTPFFPCKMYVYRLFILDANVLIFTMLWLLYTIVNINILKRNHQRTSLGKALRAWIKQLAEPASLTCLGFLLYLSLQCKCYTTRCHISSTVAVV